jgi:hypothetical protein
MAEQGPYSLFLGKTCKVVFGDGTATKTATGKMVSFDDQCAAIERMEGNIKITNIITRTNIQFVRLEEKV